MLLLQNPSTDSGFSAGNWSNVLSINQWVERKIQIKLIASFIMVEPKPSQDEIELWSHCLHKVWHSIQDVAVNVLRNEKWNIKERETNYLKVHFTVDIRT